MSNSSRARQIIRVALCWAVLTALGCAGQSNAQPLAETSEIPASAWRTNADRYRVIRAIEDPGTHQLWLFVHDLRRPAAPAMLVRAFDGLSASNGLLLFSGPASSHAHIILPPVICRGDSIIVEEHTAVTDARLEATALSAAAIREPLSARLKIGGRVVRAAAVAPGRARILSFPNEAHR